MGDGDNRTCRSFLFQLPRWSRGNSSPQTGHAPGQEGENCGEGTRRCGRCALLCEGFDTADADEMADSPSKHPFLASYRTAFRDNCMETDALISMIRCLVEPPMPPSQGRQPRFERLSVPAPWRQLKTRSEKIAVDRRSFRTCQTQEDVGSASACLSCQKQVLFWWLAVCLMRCCPTLQCRSPARHSL
jgi:hypothetical protein